MPGLPGERQPWLKQVSQPLYLVVQWAPSLHPCQEVLGVLQGLEAPVAQEAQGAQPHPKALW